MEKQTTNLIQIGSPFFNVQYENDHAENFLSWIPLVPTGKDSRRMGLFYFNFGPFRIGTNSEKTRDIVQNQAAHGLIKGGTSYYYKKMDLKWRWYWGFGFSGGGTLW